MFDPYRKWLGIPPKDQPPNHYRLLGLELFESDLDVIEGAADRQMGFVRQYQSGEYAAEAAKILNELAMARLCLLKSSTKSAYDDKLRQQLAPEPEPVRPAERPSFSQDLQPEFSSSKQKKPTRSASALSPQMMLMGGGAVAIVCLLLVVIFARGKQPAPINPSESVPAAVAKTESSNNATTPEATTGAGAIPPDSNTVLWKGSKLGSEPAGESVDLMKQVDLNRDIAHGKWERTNTALISDRHSRIYLPAKLPEDYQLRIAARRVEGTDVLAIGFMMAGRQGVLTCDGFGARFNGVYVDGREPNDNCTTRPGALFQGNSIGTIVLTVHPGHLHATFDGQTIVDWFGDPERLFLHSHWLLGCRECPFVGTVDAKYVIESATLIPLKPEPSLTRIARLDREFDIMPLLDLDRDAAKGIWGINKNTLYSPQGWSRLYVPTIVPREYTLSATVELPSEHQGGYDACIGLVAESAYFQFVAGQGFTGLDLVDGRRWNDWETRFTKPLKPGVPTRIDCTVTKGGIRIDVDGRTVTDWRGDHRRLSIPGDWALADSRRLYLGATCHLKYRNLKIGPPLAAPKLPDHPPVSIGKPIDLLALIDPARDAAEGAWERDGVAVKCRGDVQHNKLVVPFEAPVEYRLTANITRIEGGQSNTGGLILGLPTPLSTAMLAVDAYGSTMTGVHLDYGFVPESAGTRRGDQLLPLGKSREIFVEVRATGLRVLCEGTEIVDWKGNPARFWLSPDWSCPTRRLLIASDSQGFRFDRLSLEALPSSSFPSAPALGTDGNVLSIVNVERDSRRGEWKLDGSGLTAPRTSGSRLKIPVPPFERYVLKADVERLEGSDSFALGLSVGGHPSAVQIDGGGGTSSALTFLDRKDVMDSINLTRRTYKSPLLAKGRTVQVRCLVLPDTVVITCDDKEVIRWHGDPRRLSDNPHFSPPNMTTDDDEHLWIGTWETSFLIRALQLQPMNDDQATKLAGGFDGVFPTVSQAERPIAISDAKSITPTSPDPSTPSKARPSVATLSGPVSRLPVPKRGEIEAARTKILKAFVDEYKEARSVAAKLQLADRLLQRAADQEESPADRYAYFAEARDIQFQIGDALAAFRVVDSMALTFDLSRIEEQADLVQRVAKRARNAAQNRYAAVISWKLAADAAAEEDYATAKEICQKAVSAARSAADTNLQNRAAMQLQNYSTLQTLWKAAHDAEQTLKKQPNDDAAQLAIGEYRCWVRRDWANGLKPLHKTGDWKLEQFIRMEFSNPTEAQYQRPLGEVWLRYAKEQKNPIVRESAAERAATWYEKTLAGSSDADKPKIETQLEAAYELAGERNFTPLLAAAANGIAVRATVDCQSKIETLKVNSTFDTKKSWMLSLEFNPSTLIDGNRQQILSWGDATTEEVPLGIWIAGSLLSAGIENSTEHRSHAIDFRLPATTAGQWTDLKLMYSAVSTDLELHINHRLIRREYSAATPILDPDRPVVLGGIDGTKMRFLGQVRNVWLGNVP